MIVVGAGLCGAISAYHLAQRGIRVVLIDPRPACPKWFKAEKIEPAQADLFRYFGLMDALLPHCAPIKAVLDSRGPRVLQAVHLEQYGIAYYDMVNVVRRMLPSSVDFRLDQAVEAETTDDVQTVKLASGAIVTGRLLVLATGAGGELAAKLKLEREMIRKGHSVAFGFDIAPDPNRRFDFDSLTYYPDSVDSQLGYLTLFRFTTVMRANLFSFRPMLDDWSRAFLKQPKAKLLEMMPQLPRLIGDFEIQSKLESARIDLYRYIGAPRPGLIPAADSGQNVCPTTGTGLTKVLTDCLVLCERIPEWLSTPGMSAAKTAQWHQDPRKVASDRKSLAGAEYQRSFSTDTSWRWRLHRKRAYFDMWRSGGAEARMFTKKLTA